MIFNHYFEELGFKSTDYPFEDYDGGLTYDKDNFAIEEFYSLDMTLAMYIYSHLCHFRDNCLVGYPAYMTEDEWRNILNKMIKAFKLYITRNNLDRDHKELSKNEEKQIKYGMRLFIKYFGHLWY